MGFDTEKVIAIRKDIHKHAEGAFKEFRTAKLIKDTLIGYGLKEEHIKPCAGTGMVVDIYGLGEDVECDGAIKSIALRADMDALPMPENNPDLDYKTCTDWAHMCGHDGHVATMLTACYILI